MTRPCRHRVSCIVDNFGFGPACGLLDSIQPVVDDYDWQFFSTGQALSLLAKCVPSASLTDVNPWDRAAWAPLLARLPAGPQPSIVVSYPALAGFLLANRRTVIHIDQLHWMWRPDESLPENLRRTEASRLREIIPWYFGAPRSQGRIGTDVRPILPHDITSVAHSSPDPSKVLLAFGGMGMAGVPSGSDSYALWITDQVLDAMRQTLDNGHLTVVGGSPTFIVAGRELYPGVTLLECLPRGDYLSLMLECGHHVLTPGLASIYEADALGLAPIFVPGPHKSMLLQSEALIQHGYGAVCEWPWQPEILKHITNEPELNCLPLIASLLDKSLTDKGAASSLASELAEHLGTRTTAPLNLRVPIALPTAQQTLQHMLRSFDDASDNG